MRIHNAIFGGRYLIVTPEEREGVHYCEECGAWFDTPRHVEWDECRGEYLGSPCTEHIVEVRCPICDSENIITREFIREEENKDEDG